jgi:hypothetical protein
VRAVADIPTIYVLIIIGWSVLLIGFIFKEYAIAAIASFLLMILGVYSMVNGLNGTNDWLTQGFSMIMIGVGAYVVIRGGYELYKDM